MHIVLESQVSNSRSVLCIERDSSHAEVVEAAPEHLDQLVSIARAMGVDELVMTVHPTYVDELVEKGWSAKDMTVMKYDRL